MINLLKYNDDDDVENNKIRNKKVENDHYLNYLFDIRKDYLDQYFQIIEYYKEYQLDYFEVKDIQDLRNYLNFSEIKFLNREEVQEQIKKDILQCAFERGDDLMIRGIKEDLLPLLEFFDKIQL